MLLWVRAPRKRVLYMRQVFVLLPRVARVPIWRWLILLIYIEVNVQHTSHLSWSAPRQSCISVSCAQRRQFPCTQFAQRCKPFQLATAHSSLHVGNVRRAPLFSIGVKISTIITIIVIIIIVIIPTHKSEIIVIIIIVIISTIRNNLGSTERLVRCFLCSGDVTSDKQKHRCPLSSSSSITSTIAIHHHRPSESP